MNLLANYRQTLIQIEEEVTLYKKALSKDLKDLEKEINALNFSIEKINEIKKNFSANLSGLKEILISEVNSLIDLGYEGLTSNVEIVVKGNKKKNETGFLNSLKKLFVKDETSKKTTTYSSKTTAENKINELYEKATSYYKEKITYIRVQIFKLVDDFYEKEEEKLAKKTQIILEKAKKD